MISSTHQTALIGHTGFVGSNILNGIHFSATYNSANFKHLTGGIFELVVCAGVSATKWLANRNPDEDWRRIEELWSVLETVDAQTFVLISTVDVYPHPHNVSESHSPISNNGPQFSYGNHRRELELRILRRFENAKILRLPGLFGPGLKKNVIFDLVNGNNVDQIDPNSMFQWYPTRRLASDLRILINSDIRVLNVAPEPILTKDIAHAFFPNVNLQDRPGPPAQYDMRTEHPGLLGGSGHYHFRRDEILCEMKHFLG